MKQFTNYLDAFDCTKYLWGSSEGDSEGDSPETRR